MTIFSSPQYIFFLRMKAVWLKNILLNMRHTRVSFFTASIIYVSGPQTGAPGLAQMKR
jgi:hypothetical protein